MSSCFFSSRREDADLRDVGGQEAPQHGVAERAGAAGDEQGLVGEHDSVSLSLAHRDAADLVLKILTAAAQAGECARATPARNANVSSAQRAQEYWRQRSTAAFDFSALNSGEQINA